MNDPRAAAKAAMQQVRGAVLTGRARRPSPTRLLEMLSDRFGAFERDAVNQLCAP